MAFHRTPIALATTLLLTSGLIGCETVQRAPETVRVTAKVPTLAHMSETAESQEKGGVRISVATVPFKAVQSHRTQDVVTGEGTNHTRNGIYRVRYFDRVTTPVMNVEPERLCVQVKIQNKLPRVFRGNGTVVQFVAGGKNQPVDPSAYADLVNVIVPPRGEAEVTIYGPLVNSLPDTTTVALNLYDVVTATDSAGNVTEKQNFEWLYNYSTQLSEATGEKHVVPMRQEFR